MRSCPSKAQNDSGAKAEIVLPVIRAVRKFGHEVFGLQWTNREVSGDPEIDTCSRGHSKRAHRPKGDSIRRPYTSEKHLGEWRDDVPP
jgi:hypothetical protein